MNFFQQSAVALAGALITASAGAVVAAGPTLVPGTLNMFRDFRGANSVGSGTGDRIQFGADIVGGSNGATLGAVAATGFVVSPFACNPLSVDLNFCSRTTAFNSARLDPWQFTFTKDGASTTVTGPSLSGANLVPFPTSVTMSGTGLTPTISWVVPNGFAPDGFRVQIFDKNRVLPAGGRDIIYAQALPGNAASFTLPGTIGLSTSGSYAINFQLIETRGHVVFTGSNAQILSRSNSFFDFTPLSGNAPTEIALPTIAANGVYSFSVGNVGSDHITFIDPEVAVGYHYAIGAGGPNFQSLLLPNVGDGQYTLAYNDASGAHNVSVAHDQQFFFGSGGVAAFTITGIETAAMLDPSNGTAFITGLTFASTGTFTGTMTPITVQVAVPEPASLALLGLGLGTVMWSTRRRRATLA